MWRRNTRTNGGAEETKKLEDNEAVIKIIYKGRSPNMKQVLRTFRVDTDVLIELIRTGPSVFLKYRFH